VNDIEQLTRGYNNLGELVLEEGQVDHAGELYDAARIAAARFGHWLGQRWLDAQEGVHYYYAGDWERSQSLLDAYLAEVEDGSPHYMESSARFARAGLRYARGDTGGALEDVDRGITLARAAKDPQAVIALTGAARILFAEGKVAETLSLLREALGHGYVPYYAAFDAAWLQYQLGAQGAKLEVPTASEAWRFVAADLAEGKLVELADRLSAIGYVVEEAHVRLRAAEELVAAGRRAEADEQLRRALAYFRSVGASRYVREGEALLAASA
jgi:ATP/maltotriose-dependent transcriptional regulator MalT